MDHKPLLTVTNEILACVSSVSERVGRITAIGNMEAKPHLRKNNRIGSIHSSLRIKALQDEIIGRMRHTG